jgi:hypothetical protein
MSRRMNIDEMQAIVDRLVKEGKIPEEEYQKMVADAEKEILGMGTVPDEMVDYYVLKRIQLGLKVRLSSSSSEMEGFFIGQHAPFDFAAKPRQTVADYIDKTGKIKAIELGICDSMLTPLVYYVENETNRPVAMGYGEEVDSEKFSQAGPLDEESLADAIRELGSEEAQKNGYMNEKGEYLYTNDQYRNGQVIPAHDWSRVGYALVTAPGEKEPKIAVVNMRGDEALNGVPLFKVGRFSGRVNQRKSGPNHLEMSMKGGFTITFDEDVDYWEHDDTIQELVPERCLEGLDEIEGFVTARQNEFKRWCIVQADIMDVGDVTANGVAPIQITDYSLSSLKSHKTDLTFWIERDMLSGLQDNTLDAILVLSPYIKKDGTVSGNCIGYWVDPMFKVDEPDSLSDEEVLEGW